MSRILATAFGAMVGTFVSGLIVVVIAVRRWARARRLRHDPYRSRE